MTPLHLFREQMAERRRHPRGSAEHRAASYAARRYWWMHIGRPTSEWPKGYLDAT